MPDSSAAPRPSAIPVSPGLYDSPDDGAAYELKFLMSDAQAEQVESRLRQDLTLDPHGRPELQGAYRVTSLYFDTPQLHTYRRQETYRVQKYRIRRYGESHSVFLERKTKHGLQVKKLRSLASVVDLPGMVETAPEMHPSQWFLTQVAEQNVRPVCRVSYQRLALIGANAHGPVRVTFDRMIQGLSTCDWEVAPFSNGQSLLQGQVIVEFKFLLVLPTVFKLAIAELQCTPTTVSKYRQCIDATGLAPPAEPVAAPSCSGPTASNNGAHECLTV